MQQRDKPFEPLTPWNTIQMQDHNTEKEEKEKKKKNVAVYLQRAAFVTRDVAEKIYR